MKKRITLLALLFAAMQTFAEPVQHELSGYGMFGLSSLRHAGYKHGFGVGGGADYSALFNGTWGFIVGAEVLPFSASYSNAMLVRRDVQRYSYGSDMEEMHLISSYVGYEEKVSALYLHVPLMVQLQRPMGSRQKFYAAAGVKLGLALSNSYKVAAESLTTEGYFPKTDQHFADMPNHGFTTRNDLTASGSLSMKTNLSLGVEAGMRWALRERVGLYTGLYVDYGLRMLSGGVDAPLQPNGSIYADKLSLLAAGVKVKFAFSLQRKKQNCGCDSNEYKLMYRTWH